MATLLSTPCVPTSFGIPSVFGLQILSVSASMVANYNASAPAAYRFTQPSTQLQSATFCNITVSYTHPGQDDNVIVEAWLPTAENWNHRLQAVGGGGWAAGRFFLSYRAMEGALADGYATLTTDAGLGSSRDPAPWALVSPGNVDLYNLQNLGSASLNDEARIGKQLIQSFYGKGPDYSYWNGCSQGGRQGLMLAQRYPTAYDGIAVGAPAIYWPQLFGSVIWPQQVMNMLGAYPHSCEMDAITAAAVSACDGLDGVVDGVIGSGRDVEACLAAFDPFALVGTSVANCSSSPAAWNISHAAAAVVNATWRGAVTAEGRHIWHGLNPGADLTGASPSSNGQSGVAATNCSSNGTCVGVPNELGLPWLNLFINKDPSQTGFGNLTHSQFDNRVKAGLREFGSIIGTDDADLSAFQKAGGKIISFHGLMDNVIPPKSTEEYYKAVADNTADGTQVGDFFRHFEVPGLGHCFGGMSDPPTSLFTQLRAWVENGTAPERSSVVLNGVGGTGENRILCPYPRFAWFDPTCGDSAVEECWSCCVGDSHGVKPPETEL
ncbi:Tannase/feruloyl esterase [Lasiosphaeris hirsuta]|uniref:Carboxylic ester hydrolase n=1 Tax=Lasiosphaeris hirsuta TaxID=260670 RepID=A0AA40DPI7_9PEZI|nr:Tannase/feruloyl esterase [Lasiosphaeris hirsuta]